MQTHRHRYERWMSAISLLFLPLDHRGRRHCLFLHCYPAVQRHHCYLSSTLSLLKRRCVLIFGSLSAVVGLLVLSPKRTNRLCCSLTATTETRETLQSPDEMNPTTAWTFYCVSRGVNLYDGQWIELVAIYLLGPV